MTEDAIKFDEATNYKIYLKKMGGEFANVLYKLLYDEKEKINLDLLKDSNVKADNWAGKSVVYLLDKKLITL